MRGNSGFGLIEVMLGLGVLALLVTSVALISTASRERSTDLSSTSSCATLVNGITSAIKAYDNTLTVRNWLTRASTPLEKSLSAQDPYCSKGDGRTAVCDTFPLYQNAADGYLDQNDYQNYQNIRGAFTWAQNVYNTYRNDGICSMTLLPPKRAEGKTFSVAEFGNLLPRKMILPDWVTDFQLFIKGKEEACGTELTSSKSTLELQVLARYRTRPTAQLDACASMIALSVPQDTTKPAFQLLSVTNGDGLPVLPGRCTDTRTYDQVQANGVGDRWKTVRFQTRISEPGALLACRKGWNNADPANRFKNCADMVPPGGGASGTDPDDTKLGFNSQLDAGIIVRGLADTGGMQDPANQHNYQIKAVDVAGNESSTVSYSFFMSSPRCPIERDNYCPRAVPNRTPEPQTLWIAPSPVPAPYPTSVPFPPWTSPGINSRPWDTCMNDVCPQGTHSFCDPATAANICYNRRFADDCGEVVCDGAYRPACTADLSQVDCRQEVFTACGESCGTGTRKTCGPKGDPDDYACGTVVNDDCGNYCFTGEDNCPPCDDNDDPDVLPACPNPPPPPTPPPGEYTGRWGPFQCSRHGQGDKKTCYEFMAFPAGYDVYEVTIEVYGHRHGGSGASFDIRLYGSNADSYVESGRGDDLGDDDKPCYCEFGGVHPWNLNFDCKGGGKVCATHFKTPHVLRVNGDGRPARLFITSFVNDAESQVFWSVRAYNNP